jgi:hypothetical protein
MYLTKLLQHYIRIVAMIIFHRKNVEYNAKLLVFNEHLNMCSTKFSMLTTQGESMQLVKAMEIGNKTKFEHSSNNMWFKQN